MSIILYRLSRVGVWKKTFGKYLDVDDIMEMRHVVGLMPSEGQEEITSPQATSENRSSSDTGSSSTSIPDLPPPEL